jgi:hypothetical protein
MNYKFRVFDKPNKEMRYSDKHDGEFYINLKGILYMYGIPKSTDYYINYNVMQYIGLKDKNGKEIYTGDVLCDYRLDGTYRMYKIFKRKGGFVFNTHSDDFKKPVDKILFTEACADMQNAGFLETCEIGGNYIVNPELYTDATV